MLCMEEPVAFRWPSEKSDNKFLKEMGIAPCPLPDPYFRAGGPGLTADDERFLEEVHVTFSAKFTPPRDMGEYLARYPLGVAEAARSESILLGYSLTGKEVRGLAEEVVAVLRAPVEGGTEDSIGMYAAVRQPGPGDDRELHFLNYVRLRVLAALPPLLGEEEIGE